MSEQLAEAQRLPLHRRLKLLINRISDSLPDKVEKASLGDATRALSTLLTLSEALATKEAEEAAKKRDVTEKLMRLLDRYGVPMPADYTGDEARRGGGGDLRANSTTSAD